MKAHLIGIDAFWNKDTFVLVPQLEVVVVRYVLKQACPAEDATDLRKITLTKVK
jgi:hypothetical protein